jgi:hypothetical protein
VSETRIQRASAGTKLAEIEAWRDVLFTVERARRALTYVAAIVIDASDAFRIACECRRGLALATDQHLRFELAEKRDAALRRLNIAIDECNAVGADLISIPNGVLRFPGMLENRRVSLVWRRGELVEKAWDNLLTPERVGA